MNKYHFTISIHFKSDYEVKNLENILKLKPYSVTSFENSRGKEKSAKFVYRTSTLTETYTDELFEQFVNKVKTKLLPLPEILKNNNGTCTFRIVFDELNEKPCLSLSNKVLAELYKLNANYDVVFN